MQGFERFRSVVPVDAPGEPLATVEISVQFLALIEFCAIPTGDNWTAYRIFDQSYVRGTAKYEAVHPFDGTSRLVLSGEANGVDALGVGNLPEVARIGTPPAVRWGAVFTPRLPIGRHLIWAGTTDSTAILPDVCGGGQFDQCSRVTGELSEANATYRPSISCERDNDPRPGFDDIRREDSQINWASGCGRGEYLLRVSRERTTRAPRTPDGRYSLDIQTTATWTYTPTCPCDGGGGDEAARPIDPMAAEAFARAVAAATGQRPNCPGCGG